MSPPRSFCVHDVERRRAARPEVSKLRRTQAVRGGAGTTGRESKTTHRGLQCWQKHTHRLRAMREKRRQKAEWREPSTPGNHDRRARIRLCRGGRRREPGSARCRTRSQARCPPRGRAEWRRESPPAPPTMPADPREPDGSCCATSFRLDSPSDSGLCQGSRGLSSFHS